MAIIKKRNGLEITFGGPEEAGWLPPKAAPPPSERTVLDLSIDESLDGFYLISESSNPKFRGGDSWHKTMREALEQARFEFGVSPDEWEDITQA